MPGHPLTPQGGLCSPPARPYTCSWPPPATQTLVHPCSSLPAAWAGCALQVLGTKNSRPCMRPGVRWLKGSVSPSKGYRGVPSPEWGAGCYPPPLAQHLPLWLWLSPFHRRPQDPGPRRNGASPRVKSAVPLFQFFRCLSPARRPSTGPGREEPGTAGAPAPLSPPARLAGRLPGGRAQTITVNNAPVSAREERKRFQCFLISVPHPSAFLPPHHHCHSRAAGTGEEAGRTAGTGAHRTRVREEEDAGECVCGGKNTASERRGGASGRGHARQAEPGSGRGE